MAKRFEPDGIARHAYQLPVDPAIVDVPRGRLNLVLAHRVIVEFRCNTGPAPALARRADAVPERRL